MATSALAVEARPEPPEAREMDRPAIATLAVGHLFNDVNQGAVPAMLPVLVAAYALGPLVTTPLLMAAGLPGAVWLAVPAAVIAVFLAARLPALVALAPQAAGGLKKARPAAGGEDAWGPFARLTATIVCRSAV